MSNHSTSTLTSTQTGTPTDTQTGAGDATATGRVHPAVATPRRARTARHVGTRFTFSRLQGEWDRLTISAEAVRTARAWGLGITIRTLDDVLVASGYGQLDHSVVDDDPMIAALLLQARTDQLAARVMLQRMLPGLAVLARRRAHAAGDAYRAADELLVAAWTVIRTYPVERRPRFIAANLLRDSDYYAFRREFRRHQRDRSCLQDSFDDTPATEEAPSVGHELAEFLAYATSMGVSEADIRLAERLAAGASSAELAAEIGVTDRTIRNHRRAMVERLRSVANAGVASGAFG